MADDLEEMLDQQRLATPEAQRTTESRRFDTIQEETEEELQANVSGNEEEAVETGGGKDEDDPLEGAPTISHRKPREK